MNINKKWYCNEHLPGNELAYIILKSVSIFIAIMNEAVACVGIMG